MAKRFSEGRDLLSQMLARKRPGLWACRLNHQQHSWMEKISISTGSSIHYVLGNLFERMYIGYKKAGREKVKRGWAFYDRWTFCKEEIFTAFD